MGGAERVLAEGQRAFDEGGLSLGARVLNHLVFAAPDTRQDANCSRHAPADGVSGRERDLAQHVSGRRARAGRGAPTRGQLTQSADLVAATPTSYILDLLAVRLNPERSARAATPSTWFPERNRTFRRHDSERRPRSQRDQTVDGPTVTSPRAVFRKPWRRKACPRRVVRTTASGRQEVVEALGEVFSYTQSQLSIVTPDESGLIARACRYCPSPRQSPGARAKAAVRPVPPMAIVGAAVELRLGDMWLAALPDGALWIADSKTLIVSDLHLEKGSSLPFAADAAAVRYTCKRS